MAYLMEATVARVVQDEEEETTARDFVADILGPEWVVIPGEGAGDASAA